MKKVILFKGGVETLEFFSLQINESLIRLGCETFIFDIQEQFDSFNSLLQFCRRGEAVMITFNFIGLSGEEIFNANGRNFFNDYEIRCINIVVDHPFYYNKNLRVLPDDYVQFCIDRTHIGYMRRFFPDVKQLSYLPLAGTPSAGVIKTGLAKIPDREIEILFTGNYTPPSHFEKQITRLNNDYTEFYYGIIDDLLSNPDMTMDNAFEKHIRTEIPDISDEDLARCMENMIFIDLYVRFYMRGKVVQTLVDNGFKVHVYGLGLDMIPYRHPENLIIHGAANSAMCLKKLSQSKISLNVMPWFKDGAHDRIFNAAMNGAVSLTDDSIYLNELFDDSCMQFYHLKQIELLPELTDNLLKNPDRLQSMSDKAYRITADSHTWADRTKIIMNYI